jgi:hypothetical protein
MKIYFAGKVNPIDGVQDWRGEWTTLLANKLGIEVINLDPTKADKGVTLDLGDPDMVFGRDSKMIKESDVVIINVTDDVGVGASQEMMIAKYFNKPLIAITKLNGRYWREERIVNGTSYKNWMNPFLAVPCDLVVENIEDTVEFLGNLDNYKAKGISIIDESIKNYLSRF